MLGCVYLYLGVVSIETEEIATGEKHLEKCNSIIEDHYMKPEVLLVAVNMFNQFGILWSQREPEKSKIYLEKAVQLYLDFKNDPTNLIDMSQLFQTNIENYDIEIAKRNLEKAYTLTLYYLAQIFGALKDALKSSVYCHITLQRQLQMKDYDPIDWALNAATLSQFFMERNGFKQARHHLAASSVILEQYEKELEQMTERDEAYEAKMEVFKHRSADVARCWSKYGLLLLSKSKERLLSHTDDINVNCSLTTDLSKLSLSSDSTVSENDLQHLDFEGLELYAHEYQVTDQFVLTLEDARRVFVNIQSWLSKAMEYYTLDNLASDYIEIVQDQSQMYLNLLFFDENQDNQAKLHKRRVDLLQGILNSVNPQFYLQYCRQVWFELAQAYADILDIKAEKLKESKGRPKPQALQKINHLVEKSIQNYMNFVESYREKPSGNWPKVLPEDAVKPYLQANFHIAALHGRYITLEKHRQLLATEQSLKYYKVVVDFCANNEKGKEVIAMELGICQEMVTLLPIKIAKLRQEMI